MTTLCHNCRHAVPENATFCPECGAPQLRVAGVEVREAEREANQAFMGDHTDEIAWPAAVRSAAFYAVPTGLLLSFLAVPLIDMVWVVGGTVWTLRRYRRRAPRAPSLTPQLGGRIGLVLGLFAAVLSTALESISLMVERYGMHRGADIDGPLRQQVQQAFGRIDAMHTEAAAQLPALYHFWLSSEGQGSLLLVSTAMSVLSVLFFAWLGGRFAVRYGWVRHKRG